MPVERPKVGIADNDIMRAMPVFIVNSAGEYGSGKYSYTLLNNVAATGSGVGPIAGGNYIWRVEATSWNGATATLQYQQLDGVTWTAVRTSAPADVAFTANGVVAVTIGDGSIMRVLITGGPPAGVRSNLAGF